MNKIQLSLPFSSDEHRLELYGVTLPGILKNRMVCSESRSGSVRFGSKAELSLSSQRVRLVQKRTSCIEDRCARIS